MIIKKGFYAGLCILSTSSFAVENGNSSYANGAENFMSAVVPPPGVHDRFLDRFLLKKPVN